MFTPGNPVGVLTELARVSGEAPDRSLVDPLRVGLDSFVDHASASRLVIAGAMLGGDAEAFDTAQAEYLREIGETVELVTTATIAERGDGQSVHVGAGTLVRAITDIVHHEHVARLQETDFALTTQMPLRRRVARHVGPSRYYRGVRSGLGLRGVAANPEILTRELYPDNKKTVAAAVLALARQEPTTVSRASAAALEATVVRQLAVERRVARAIVVASS